MKKIILSLTALLLLFCGTVLAEGIGFTGNKDWKALLAQAKRENKLIFLDAYASWCGPCKYLQNSVFTDESVGAYFNAAFINAKIDMEKGEGPTLSDLYEVTAYPTLLFINGDGKVVHKSVGAMEAEDLIQLGREAINPATQYYTLKAKAENGELDPAALYSWMEAAERLEDDDADNIVKNYLAQSRYPFMQKDMLRLVLDYGSGLTEEHIRQLVANKERIAAILEMDEQEYQEKITPKIISYATDQSLKDEVMDMTGFSQILTRYIPAQAALETSKMKVRYYFYKKQDNKGLDELALLISEPGLQLPASEMANLIVDRAEAIKENKRSAEFVAKIGKYKFMTSESGQVYYRDFALLAIYYYMEDKPKIDELCKRISSNPDTPEELKEIVEKIKGS